MKKILLKTLAPAVLIAGCLYSGSGLAQTTCTTTNSLNINTGIDASGLKIPFSASGTADPFWSISAMTGGVPASVVVGSQAVITTNTVMASSTTSNLISYSATGGSTGYTTTPANPDFGAFSLTFRRKFTTCKPDDLTFNFNMAYDNYLVSILIDGLPVAGAVSPVMVSPSYYQWGNIFSATFSLPAGTHTIDVRIGNENTQAYPQPTSLNIRGTVTGTSSSIVTNDSPTDCACQPVACNDQCYWKLTGNTILNGNRTFGTLTPDDIDIKTSANNRGKITAGGLLGWNTMNPTAWLHVNCAQHNDGTTASDIRFENLEAGTDGNILIIRKDGYVFDSKIPISALRDLLQAQRQEIDELKTLVEEQRTRIGTSAVRDGYLRQNTPNPFSVSTVIEYGLPKGAQKAAIGVYDMNGREIRLYQLSPVSGGSVTIQGGDLKPGMYVYTLIVDGKYFDSKKMVLTSQ